MEHLGAGISMFVQIFFFEPVSYVSRKIAKWDLGGTFRQCVGTVEIFVCFAASVL